MGFTFVADLHLHNHKVHGGPVSGGVNQRARFILDTLHQVADLAADANNTLVILGDVFDTVRPEPQLITGLMHALSIGEHIILKGNHDFCSSQEGDHSLGPLNFSEFSKVVASPQIAMDPSGKHGLIAIPFQPGPATEWLPQILQHMSLRGAVLEDLAECQTRSLALHLGIHDAEMRAANPWVGSAQDAVPVELLFDLCRKYHIDAVFAGNWHGHKTWEDGAGDSYVKVVQVGALVPTGWDNPGIDGYGVASLYNDGKFQFQFNPGSRFIVVRSWDELREFILDNKSNGNMLYVRWDTDPAGIAEATRCLQAAQDYHEIVAFSVRVNKTEILAMAREAASAVRSSTTLDAALVAYVKTMALAEGVDRDEVFDRCKELLSTDAGFLG